MPKEPPDTAGEAGNIHGAKLIHGAKVKQKHVAYLSAWYPWHLISEELARWSSKLADSKQAQRKREDQ